MKAVAFDTETTGFELYRGHKMFSWSWADEDGNVGVHRVDSLKKGVRKKSMDALQALFDDTSTAKVCHNLKFDLAAILGAGIQVPKNTVFHDTIIMSQMLQNLAPTHALEKLCSTLCNYPTTNDELVKKYTRGGKGYHTVPKKIMDAYQKDDVVRTMLLFQLWWPEIQEDAALLADYWNEMVLIPITQRMEARGIMIHKRNTEALLADLEEKVQDAYDEVYSINGEHLNLNSSPQVAGLLYQKLEMMPPKLTATGQPSTSKDAIFALLKDYQHPVLHALSKHRSYSHGIPIVASYLDHMDKNSVVHCTINTNRAKTGRQSASKPNMQNVSKEQALANPYPIPARKCFRARPGYVNFHVDYAGIEMRLAINVSKDQAMVDLVESGGDPHAEAATIFYGSKFMDEQDTKKKKILRSAAKNGQFAIIYGASDKRLAETILLPRDEARKVKKLYGQKFPGIMGLSKNLIREVKEKGYIKTPFGRKLQVYRDKAYISTNYLIQGTAAGVLKRAQVRVARYLQEACGDAVQLLLPIHDELVIEYSRQYLGRYKEILGEVSRLMCDFKEFVIPMAVEWKLTTTTWDKAKDVNI